MSVSVCLCVSVCLAVGKHTYTPISGMCILYVFVLACEVGNHKDERRQVQCGQCGGIGGGGGGGGVGGGAATVGVSLQQPTISPCFGSDKPRMKALSVTLLTPTSCLPSKQGEGCTHDACTHKLQGSVKR